MKFACRPLFLFLVPVVACRREESLKAWRLIPCIRASNLGHCSCCSWQDCTHEKVKRSAERRERYVSYRFIQLVSNYLSTSSNASDLRQGSRNPGTAACCQHVIKPPAFFNTLCQHSTFSVLLQPLTCAT